jgi:BTB/POZ domain
MTDVKFIVQGQEIGAHLNIISHNPVMATMLNVNFVEGQSRQVIINNIEPETFRHLLHYLYNPVPPLIVEVSKLEQLLAATEMYQLVGLKQFCEESLIVSLEEDNVVRLLVIAHLQSANRLLETCYKFLSNTSDAFWSRVEWKELMYDYPDLFFQASNRMCVNLTQ